MSDESKPYPASELKLERLRSEGEIPYSPEVDSAAVLIGLFCVALLLTGLWEGVFQDFVVEAFSYSANEGTFSENSFEELSNEKMSSFSQSLLALISIILVPFVGLLMLLGLLQTRFLFSFSALGLKFSRLFDLTGLTPRAFIARFFRALTAFALSLAGLLIAFVVIRYFFTSVIDSNFNQISFSLSEPLSLSAFEELSFVAFLQSMSYFAIGALIGGSLLLACGAYFFRVFHFKAIHRMSRAELEAEYREMEPSAELLTARKEQLLESEEE